jgi:L-alanine-DL-glutamate epimerase-like enolase superfamily enzyme
VPIASGENACTVYEFEKLLAAEAVTYAQPSVTKLGGVTEFRKVAALAEANGIALRPHSPYFGPGFLATLHLAAAQPLPPPVERFYLPLGAQLYGDLVDPVDGMFVVPPGPGLGLEPDPAVINAFRVR